MSLKRLINGPVYCVPTILLSGEIVYDKQRFHQLYFSFFRSGFDSVMLAKVYPSCTVLPV